MLKSNLFSCLAVIFSIMPAGAFAAAQYPAQTLAQLTPPAATQLLTCSSVEGAISFTVSESYVKGVYDHSGSILTYEGITYEIGKFSTGYDQNVGEVNVATLFSVAIPYTNPAVFFTFDIPRSQTSLALNANVATSILMGSKKFAAVCHTL